MLSSVAARMLAQFAYHGRQEWPPYNTRDRATYVLDEECRLEQQPDDDLYDYWIQVLVNETS